VQNDAKQGEDAIWVRQAQPMHAGAMVRVGDEVHEKGLIARHVHHFLWMCSKEIEREQSVTEMRS
jgi:hypothetical protein